MPSQIFVNQKVTGLAFQKNQFTKQSMMRLTLAIKSDFETRRWRQKKLFGNFLTTQLNSAQVFFGGIKFYFSHKKTLKVLHCGQKITRLSSNRQWD